MHANLIEDFWELALALPSENPWRNDLRHLVHAWFEQCPIPCSPTLRWPSRGWIGRSGWSDRKPSPSPPPQQLLLADADPNTFDPTGKSLLFFASESGNIELVQQLLLAGASISLAPGGPHGVAVQKGHTEVVELLEIYVKKRKGTPPMLWQLICENLLPLGTTTAYAVLLMNGEETRPREIFLGTVVPSKEGFNWFEAPAIHKNNDNMVYEYFEGQSGDGPLVLRFTKHDDNQFAASVNSLGVALLDRGLHMRSQVDSFGRHVIAIYREHIKPTTMWRDKNVMIEYESADTN